MLRKNGQRLTLSASTIFSQFVGAYTVELMDIISENLDSINIALDTDFWNGGQLYLGAIDNNFKAAIFSGTENQRNNRNKGNGVVSRS